MPYFIKITGKLGQFFFHFCVKPSFLKAQDPGVVGRNAGSISGISTVRDHPFQYHCFDVLWTVPMNRDETTWLASRIPPFSCYSAITHSSVKFRLPLTVAHRFNAGVQPLLCFTAIQEYSLDIEFVGLKFLVTMTCHPPVWNVILLQSFEILRASKKCLK